MSWPILKVALCSFNNESIEEYIGPSYKIITAKTSAKQLPVNPSKLFLHFCLSHIMHALSRYQKKFFTGNKKFSQIPINGKLSVKPFIACLWFYWLSIKTPTLNNLLRNYVLKKKDLGNRDYRGDCLVDQTT